MTHVCTKRPLLATIICFYEVFVVVLVIACYFLQLHLASSITHAAVSHHPMSLLAAVSWLGYLLALAAAITLWKMQRSAFYLLAARFGLSLVSFLIALPHLFAHWPALPPKSDGAIYLTLIAIRCVTGALFVGGLVLSAAIVWYVYGITSPKNFLPTVSEPTPSA